MQQDLTVDKLDKINGIDKMDIMLPFKLTEVDSAKNNKSSDKFIMAQKTEIIQSFKDYMAENGGEYSDWYVGIASDPKKRLFNDHNVSENAGIWIYDNAETQKTAREIEEYFISQGTDGGQGGGDSSTIYAYAYKKTAYTNEDN